MGSPFPGMDPYLERFWASVRSSLVTYLVDHLNGPVLPEDLRADFTARRVPDAPEKDVRHVSSDAYADEPVRESNICITDQSGTRLVTLIEILSAASKRPWPDRERYLGQREPHLTAGDANIVEIDLLHGGERIVREVDDRLPPEARKAYRVLIRRAAQPGRTEVYPAPLRHRLPVVGIPLRPGEPDAIIDIQPLLDRVYANGRYPIDYRKAPDPPLNPDDVAWADELLNAAGRR